MATSPMMTMRIEITMATMGRLMKNFAMVGYPFPSVGAASFFSGASGANGFGVTATPGRTFCVPSTTTVSPGCNPS